MNESGTSEGIQMMRESRSSDVQPLLYLANSRLTAPADEVEEYSEARHMGESFERLYVGLSGSQLVQLEQASCLHIFIITKISHLSRGYWRNWGALASYQRSSRPRQVSRAVTRSYCSSHPLYEPLRINLEPR